MTFSSAHNEIPNRFFEYFNRDNIGLYITEISEHNDRITCITLSVSSVDELLELWNSFNNFVGTVFLPTISNDFDKWNVYIVYAVDFIVPKDLIQRIENNKVFTRKLIIFSSNTNELLVDKLNSVILGVDLTPPESKINSFEIKLSPLTNSLFSLYTVNDGKLDSMKQRRYWLESNLDRALYHED